jgi:hypothetical protein
VRSVEHNRAAINRAAINRRATKQRRMNATIDGSPIYRALFLGQASMSVFECVRSNTIARRLIARRSIAVLRNNVA